ncbi:hypothetical protein QQP08_015337 [Theobroma cacao]|nr:hypothetical protein QQP08_015337 [Theobroma cacao]
MKESTIVRPAEETPNQRLWVSNLDLLMTIYHISTLFKKKKYHISTVYIYKPNGSSNFFDTKVLKESLSKILVPFYPVAGRLGYDENGRLEIVCNAEGVLFIEAKTTSIMDNLAKDFTDGSKIPQLVPKIDYSGGISSYPLLGLQVQMVHLHFISSIVGLTWHEITTDQLIALKVKVNENSNSNTKYSTYSILTANIWRCATKARDLLEDQELKLNIPIDGRNRLHPPLSPSYFGNVTFLASLIALAGDRLSVHLLL